MTPTTKQYYAFISYKRDDQKWAEWLQQKLEHYKLPSNLNGRSDLPKEIRPVFRDKSELAAGVLADEIQKALDNSKFLIVICSPHSAKSEWVNKEVQSFIDSGRTEKIIPFIIEGTPNSGNDETECFPKAIRELPEEDELLGVNINEMGRDAAAVKVVAQMFGLRFDDLWQRHEREKKRRRRWFTVGIVTFALMVLGVAGWIWHQNVMLKKQRWQMLESQSKLVSEMVKMNAKDDSYLARLAALEVLPKDVSNPVDRPYTAEAERALRNSYNNNSAIINGDYGELFYAIFNKDDSKIGVFSFDGAAKITTVDASSGTRIHCYNIQEEGLYSMEASLDCEKVAVSVYSDSTFAIKVFDVETKKILLTENSEREIYPLILNNNYIVTISYPDTNLRVINIIDGREIMTYKEPATDKNAANFSSDGHLLVLANSTNKYGANFISHGNREVYSENNITILDIITKEVKNKWQGHNNLISSVAFSPDDKKIVTASYDGTIKIWDVETGEELITSEKVGESLTSANFSPDGKYVISSFYDGTISIWDVETGKEIEKHFGHQSKVNYVNFSNDGKRLVSVSDDETIRLWNVEKFNGSNIITTNNYLSNIDISPDRNQIVTMFDDTTLIVVNLETKDRVMTLNLQNKYWRHNPVAFSPDGKKIVANYDDYVLKIYDVESGEVLDTLIGHDYDAYSASFNPDGSKVACVLMNSRFGVWNEDGIDTVINRYQSLSDAIYSPDGKNILLASTNSNIDVLDSDTYEYLFSLKGHKNSVNTISFSPDGKNLVSGASDNMVKIWDYDRADEQMTLIGHTDPILCVRYSPDGKYIVSSSNDKTIRIWNAETGECIYIIEGHTEGVSFADFTFDGNHIVSASKDGTIRQWDFPPLQDLIDQTRERFKNRPLTEEERKMYYLE